MRSKFLRVFLALVVALPMFTSVLAISYSDLLDRLDSVAQNIEDIKDKYQNEIEDYPDVINSLSAEGKETSDDLADGKVLELGMEARLEKLKAELASSTVEGADEVLSIVEGVEDAFEALIEDNKDVIEDVKANYSDLTTDEIKEVVEKAVEIVESLGAETDVSDTYDEMMAILNEAHNMAKDINVKLEAIISGNVSTFESALTIDLAKEIFTEVKAKDREAVIDTLIEALDSATGGAELKADLKDVKKDAVALKDKLMELDSLSEQDLLMFTDSQKTDVSNKIKAVEKDYVDFAKTVLDNYSEDYMKVVINLGYDETVDQMIEYANEALDYYAEYKDTIASLETEDVLERISLPEELIEKAGLMVALGFVDTTDYNKDYITNNFQTQIDNMAEYIANEFVEYLDHIDATINDEVSDVYQNGVGSEDTQKDLRAITSARFTTLKNVKALKSRVDTELLANYDDVKSDLAQIADYVYTMYHENILFSIEATMLKENDDPARKYEYTYMDSFVLADTFMTTSNFTKELGVPKANESVLKYTKTTNGKIRTGSVLTITLSSSTIGNYTFAVLGDVYVDGMIDARDYMAIKNYIMEDETLSKIRLAAADTYRDKVVDARDYMSIKNYIMKGEEISL